MIHGDMYIVSI